MDVQTQMALAHPRRRAILGYLMQKKGEGTGESELADFLGLTIAKVGYHLTVLRDADLILHADDSGPGAAERYVPAGSAEN
jgi:DNA-binding transcriptional ArsR family regulator